MEAVGKRRARFSPSAGAPTRRRSKLAPATKPQPEGTLVKGTEARRLGGNLLAKGHDALYNHNRRTIS
jgi:hypothetical protein